MTPILTMLLLLQSPNSLYEARFDACIDLATDDPVSAVSEASAWRMEGGTYFARHCLGLAYANQGRWSAAAQAFAAAAKEAGVAKDRRAANLWAQAGNAALAGGEAQAAYDHFTAALSQGTLKGLYLGEVHLDRARANVALERMEAAWADFDRAHELAPEDPLGWLLSATLARRTGDLKRAQADISVAAKLAPGDPGVGLEAGNIAYSAGDLAVAKRNWTQAMKLAPNSKAGVAAAKYLAQLDEAPSEKKTASEK